MLKRTLEPELMDTLEDAREYNRMDNTNVNRQFTDDLIAFASRCQSAGYDGLAIDVADLGTGTALVPIELCRRVDSVHVLAIDDAVNMLDQAVYNIEAANMHDRITLAKGDAKALVYEDETFDTTISNSLIHHLPDPVRCFAEMHRITAAGGILFVRDLARPDSDAAAQQLVQQYAGGATDYCKQLFLQSLHAALRVDEVQQIVGDLGYGKQTVTMSSDRHWTWAAVRP